jgi:hypothetical protein
VPDTRNMILGGTTAARMHTATHTSLWEGGDRCVGEGEGGRGVTKLCGVLQLHQHVWHT